MNPNECCCENCARPENQRMSTYCGKCHVDNHLMFESKKKRSVILIEKTEVIGWEQTIRSIRNPMNGGGDSDSGLCKGGDDGIGCLNCAAAPTCHRTYDHSFQIGKNDRELMMRLVKDGSVHGKFRGMIMVYVDVTASLNWWKEFDIYPYWCQTIELLPHSNQTRTMILNYEVLSNIYHDQKENEWCEFYRWIEDLPYSEIITVHG